MEPIRAPKALPMPILDREEYVEQAYLFKIFAERLPENMPLQDLFRQVRDELLASTRLPLAVDFLRSELELTGVFAQAMGRLEHYFTPFQTYLVAEAEAERGRFDLLTALQILSAEADYRSRGADEQGIFLYQFESLCRNRLRYDPGLKAVSQDPSFDSRWREWILILRRQIGLIDFAELIYGRSEFYLEKRRSRLGQDASAEHPILFGVREGRIAHANRGKDPLFLFAALQRHLGYPPVPRPKPVDENPDLIPQLSRRIERLESRIKLLEEEQRDGIDLTQFYAQHPPPASGPAANGD